MAKELTVGDPAPDLSLPDQHWQAGDLEKSPRKQVVLYFYPKDDTPGCTKESCEFRDVESQIMRAGGVILGVSLDDKESHQKFMKKFGLPFPLLSDEDAAVSKAYGVYKEKNMYGKKYWGIERSTFVIDPNGKLKAVFRKVKVDGHVDEVLTALRSSSRHYPSATIDVSIPIRCSPARRIAHATFYLLLLFHVCSAGAVKGADKVSATVLVKDSLTAPRQQTTIEAKLLAKGFCMIRRWAESLWNSS